MTVDLTENELKVVLNALWLQINATAAKNAESDTSYAIWLASAHRKLRAALPPIREFAENH